MEIPDEMLKEIRESGYDKELVFTQIREVINKVFSLKKRALSLYVRSTVNCN